MVAKRGPESLAWILGEQRVSGILLIVFGCCAMIYPIGAAT
jgi:hypothetical protein